MSLEKLVEIASQLDVRGFVEEASLLDAALVADRSKACELICRASSALDASENEGIRKFASVLDEILLTIGGREAFALAKAAENEELDKLRAKHRIETREHLYKGPKKELDKMNGTADTRKAVADQVKDYRIMEAPLQTRSCPDHPGAPMSRVADRVYQCSMDKKVYNYETGYTTMNGNHVPGGGVDKQIPTWNNIDPGHAIFDSRESKMGRFASVEHELRKLASEGFAENSVLLDDLVRSEALEGLQLEAADKAHATDELRAIAKEYDNTLRASLDTLVRELPPASGADSDELWRHDGPLSVFMTLSGLNGAGIAPWARFYPEPEKMAAAVSLLRSKLGSLVNERNGGRLQEAIIDAALDTGGLA